MGVHFNSRREQQFPSGKEWFTALGIEGKRYLVDTMLVCAVPDKECADCAKELFAVPVTGEFCARQAALSGGLRRVTESAEPEVYSAGGLYRRFHRPKGYALKYDLKCN